MAKSSAPAEKKESLLKQDLSMETIKALINSKKKQKSGPSEETSSAPLEEYIPALPEVNMLPETVKETYAAEDLRNKWIKGTIGLVTIFAVIFGISLVTENINKGKVDEIAQTTAGYQAETSKLTPYSSYRTAIEAKRNELAGKMANQVDVAKINSQFTAAVTSAGYSISSVNLSLSGSEGGGAGACVNPDPFNPATGIGCISFSLKDNGGGSMTKLISTLNGKDTGFVNAYIPNAIAGEEGSTIDGSVSIEQSFLTKQYESLTLPLDSILNSPATSNGTNAPATEGK
jgi:hypothetical protein